MFGNDITSIEIRRKSKNAKTSGKYRAVSILNRRMQITDDVGYGHNSVYIIGYADRKSDIIRVGAEYMRVHPRAKVELQRRVPNTNGRGWELVGHLE